MILLLLAYLGGVLTIVSPCILPVLPFVFARADKPFARNGLPMLIGLALTFVLVASLASVAGGWAVQANAAGRWAAMALLAMFGLTLLLPGLADRLTRPLMAAGGRLSARADRDGGIAASLLLGVATGLLWAPCAGPILGLVLTGAALKGASVGASLLLLAYALGAATSLALALLAGGRVFAAMKRSLHAGEWVRRGLGVLVLAAVAAIVFGIDTGLLTQLSSTSTAALEQGLMAKLHAGRPAATITSGAATTGGPGMTAAAKPVGGVLPVLGPMPSLAGATAWLNGPPLAPAALKGKVVMVDFWTYSCINCLRALPYVEAWAEAYGPQGLVVIGVHTPEFAFEKQQPNVERAIKRFGLTYPVAMDNDYGVWKAFQNESWPAHYFIDAQGRVRDIHLGEGQYDKAEGVIRALLAERNGKAVPAGLAGKPGAGVQAAADVDNIFSQETYLGYARANDRFASPGGIVRDKPALYRLPARTYEPDGWAYAGRWAVGAESGTNLQPGARIQFSFHARDLHMVLGPGPSSKPVRFRVTLDGKPPGGDHGLDTNAAGLGVVKGQGLYQLVRQRRIGGSSDRVFQIEFLDPGVQAYTFTFG